MTHTTLDSAVHAEIRHWLPSPAGVHELGVIHARALNEQLAQRCADVLAETDLAARAADVTRLVAPSWTTPAIAFAHYVGLAGDSPDRQAAPDALAELEHVAAVDKPPTDMAPDGEPAWVEYGVAAFGDSQPGSGAPNPVTSCQPNAQTLEAVVRAMGWLDSAWPEMADVVRDLVREIRWIELADRGYVSATFTQTFGAVFLTPAPSRTLYEFLIHEATHLELIVRMALDPLVSNRADTAASPFRTAPRPITRVLHAAVVAGRLVYGMRRCLPLVSGEERAHMQKSVELFDGHLRAALTTLDERAVFTPAGAEMIERMRSDLRLP